MKKIKHETPENKQAFEDYYAMGKDRSYDKLSEKLGVARSTVQNWAESFDWQRRVQERDAEVNKAIEARAKRINLEQRDKMIADVDATLAIIRTSLSKTLKDINEKLITLDPIKNPKQFDQITRAIERAVLLRMRLTGEIKEKQIIINLVGNEDIDL